MNKSTFSAKPTDVKRQWYLIDANDASLGRISTVAAKILTGKDKTIFTKHIDCGDYVVVINSDKLKVTGDKLKSKMYYRHSGYPGALKELKLEQLMSKDSTKVIEHSIRGMLPVNKLRDSRLKRLKIYRNDQHKHQAQQLIKIDLKEVK
jgi:large subunit ribosomal protein L13